MSSSLISHAQLAVPKATLLDFTPSDPSVLFPTIHGRRIVEESDARFRVWISPNLDWASVMVDNFPHLLYNLSLKTGDGSSLEVGRTYSQATSVYGGTPGTNGLDFSGGEDLFQRNNSLTGKFTILELEVSNTRNEFDQPEVLSFAADFTQFDDMGSLPGEPSFTVGSFRFHSSVPVGADFTPVPEPSTYGVAVAGLLGALILRRRRPLGLVRE